MCNYPYQAATASEIDGLPPALAFEAERRCHELTMEQLALVREWEGWALRFIAKKQLTAEFQRFIQEVK